jgi:RNA polymerase sigma-70 factor (ECF subfamily)
VFKGVLRVESAPKGYAHAMTDAQQFEVFMRNYQNMVFSTAMRLLARHQDAEDVAQEVFLRAYERFHQLRDSSTAGGWLKTVATNLCLNHLSRYRSRWSFFSELFGSGREDDEEREMEFPAGEDVKETLSQADRRTLVEQALRTIAPETKAAIGG